MQKAIETGKVGPYKWAIHYDQDAQNPLEWNDLCLFPYWSRRYTLGATDGRKEYGEPEDFLKLAKSERWEVLPVFAYIHSGTVLSTRPFLCAWDSGQCGFIAVTPKTGKENWGRNWRESARKYMAATVETFNQYVNGEVYGFEVSRNGEVLESCWGFFDFDNCKVEAQSIAQHLNEKNKSGKEFAAKFMCC